MQTYRQTVKQTYRQSDRHYCIVLYCIVSIHLYSASCSAHQSEALPVRETQREESSIIEETTAMIETSISGDFIVLTKRYKFLKFLNRIFYFHWKSESTLIPYKHTKMANNYVTVLQLNGSWLVKLYSAI